MKEAHVSATVELVVEYEENVDLVKAMKTMVCSMPILAEGVSVVDTEIKTYAIMGGLPIGGSK